MIWVAQKFDRLRQLGFGFVNAGDVVKGRLLLATMIGQVEIPAPAIHRRVHSPTGKTEQENDQNRSRIDENSSGQRRLRRSELNGHTVLCEQLNDRLAKRLARNRTL